MTGVVLGFFFSPPILPGIFLTLPSIIKSCFVWYSPRRLPYQMYFGGVSALTPLHYLKMNGFPNNYWGWGGEDDDIGVR